MSGDWMTLPEAVMLSGLTPGEIMGMVSRGELRHRKTLMVDTAPLSDKIDAHIHRPGFVRSLIGKEATA